MIRIALYFLLFIGIAWMANADEKKLDPYGQLQLFGNVFDHIQSKYVEDPENAELIEEAIAGMLRSLDPHSSYLNPKDYKEMQVSTEGKFGGLGIEVTMQDGLVKVVAPIDDTPAQRAGILAGDLISHLDGKKVRGMTLSQTVDKMRGDPDTDILLTILREGHDEPFKITITRAIIKIRSTRSRIEGEQKNIGYLRITTFNEQTLPGLYKNIAKLREEIDEKELAGWIVDLRNNPGGLLSQAIGVSDIFLEQGEIVSTRGKNRSDTERYHATQTYLIKQEPVIVLINGGSASASEIVAGALQDHHRAVLLGTKSFGKGSVQSVLRLPNEGALRLTTARYYTPSGRSIQALGIEPDILVEQKLPKELADKLKKVKVKAKSEADLEGHLTNEAPEEEEKSKKKTRSFAYLPKEGEEDSQLNYAISLLEQLHSSRKHIPPLIPLHRPAFEGWEGEEAPPAITPPTGTNG